MCDEYLHIKVHKVPLYGGLFVVVLTNSAERVRKYLPEFSKSYIYGHSWFHTYRNKNAFFMVLNFDNKYTEMSHGTVAHEATHIAGFIAEHCGLEASFGNDEAVAHLVGWVTNRAYDFIGRCGFGF